MEKNHRIWAVVPAAASQAGPPGEKPKQYLPLAGKTVLETTLERLLQLDQIEGVVVAIAASDIHWQKTSLVNHPRVYICLGAGERRDSVLNALKLVDNYSENNQQTWVLVHEALRPCVSLEKMEALISLCTLEGAGGILAVPHKESIKRVNSRGEIACSEDASKFWMARSPQLFNLNKLRAALEFCKDKGYSTIDEAAAIEKVGGRVKIVPDRRDNIRITSEDDLPLAEFIVQQQAE